jgi:RNA polymerase sigma-70 factor, ECF subfamily
VKHPSGQNDPSDADLLAAIARGDDSSLRALYDRYASILLGVVLRIVRSRSEAEDVLQEVFLQTWQRAADYDPARGRPFLWLSMIARSRALDRLRSLGLRERVANDAGKEPVADAADAADDVARAEEGEIVRQVLAEIPEAQREALLLAYFEGLTQTEIAARTGKPLGTVKTHTRLGLLKLRDRLSALRRAEGVETPGAPR